MVPNPFETMNRTDGTKAAHGKQSKINDTTVGLDIRVSKLEEQVKFLSQPAGDDGLSAAALADLRKEMMDKILGGVGDMMPKVLDNNLPSMTGPSLPTTKLPKF